jgi:DNA-nicking Smr family endonuclease
MSKIKHLSDSDLDAAFVNDAAPGKSRMGPRVVGILKRMSENIAENEILANADVFDFHGLTLEQAFEKLESIIMQTKQKRITVITGKSGQINSDFPKWCNGKLRNFVRTCKLDEKNAGQYIITIKRG